MATLHLRNKYDVTFLDMLKNAVKKGGTPDYIEVSVQEMAEILKEMRLEGKKSPFKLQTADTSIKFEFYNKTLEFTVEYVKNIIKEITGKRIEITYTFDPYVIPIKIKFRAVGTGPAEWSKNT